MKWIYTHSATIESNQLPMIATEEMLNNNSCHKIERNRLSRDGQLLDIHRKLFYNQIIRRVQRARRGVSKMGLAKY